MQEDSPTPSGAVRGNQVGAARERLGRDACSALLIIDAQSVKNTDPAALKGYDAGKKVLGIKRHIRPLILQANFKQTIILLVVLIFATKPPWIALQELAFLCGFNLKYDR